MKNYKLGATEIRWEVVIKRLADGRVESFRMFSDEKAAKEFAREIKSTARRIVEREIIFR